MDVDGTGKIDIDEIFMSNKIPETEWGKRVFKAIDIDGSGCLSFDEFFVGLYNYLAGDQNFVQKMAFDMSDDDGGGKLSIDELRQLLILVHGKGPNKKSANELNKKIKNLMLQLDRDRSGTVTFAEFQLQGKKIQSLFKRECYPILLPYLISPRNFDTKSSRLRAPVSAAKSFHGKGLLDEADEAPCGRARKQGHHPPAQRAVSAQRRGCL
jgi:Ca2+-binding EF-hand superfamily protein